MNEIRTVFDSRLSDQGMASNYPCDGLYRHIRFRKQGTICMHFNLITGPGYLCHGGEMGTSMKLTIKMTFHGSDQASVMFYRSATLRQAG